MRLAAGVEARRHGAPEGRYWNVVIWVAEFLREDPLETELRGRIASALGAVDGVADVAEEDREVWYVTGAPSGEALARAAAVVVDEFADRARAYVARLDEDAAH